MKTGMKFLAVLLLAAMPMSSLWAGGIFGDKDDYKYSDKKTITKRFTVDPDVRLNLDITYGDVEIIATNENVVDVTVNIEVKTNDEDMLRKYIDAYKVDFDGSTSENVDIRGYRDMAEVKTSLFKRFRNNISSDIDFIIRVPKQYIPNVDLTYCDLDLQDLEQSGKFKLAYGDMEARTLKGTDNKIQIDYGDLEVEAIEGAEVDVDYGEISIRRANSLEISNDYSDSEIGTVERLVVDNSYGDIEIDAVSELIIDNMMYSDLSIDRLVDSFICSDFGYGEMNIGVMSSVRLIQIDDVFYSDIDLSVPSSLNFQASILGSYIDTNVEGNSAYKVSKLVDKGSRTEIEFTSGTGSAQTTISVNARYGDVKFFKR